MINLARVVPATEVTSGGETIASGEKIGKSGRKVGGGKGGGQKVGGGKVVKVPKVAKEKVNNSKKDARPKPSIDGLTFSVSPVKMKKVSLSPPSPYNLAQQAYLGYHNDHPLSRLFHPVPEQVIPIFPIDASFSSSP